MHTDARHGQQFSSDSILIRPKSDDGTLLPPILLIASIIAENGEFIIVDNSIHAGICKEILLLKGWSTELEKRFSGNTII